MCHDSVVLVVLVVIYLLTWFCLQARKAHRALRGLVKLQALVRGFLVRKRAAATLLGMQALIRAQTSVRYQRARRSFNKENRFLPESRPRKPIVSSLLY